MFTNKVFLFLAISMAIGITVLGFTACATSGKNSAVTPQAKVADAKQQVASQPEQQGKSATELANQQTIAQDEMTQKELTRKQAAERARILNQQEADRLAAEAQKGNLAKVYFDYDKAELKQDARELLAKDAAIIKSSPNKKFVVEGHCDERGTEQYNLALGEKRAGVVKKYLSSLGINPAQLETTSYGMEKPEDAGHTEAAWSHNRRVQFAQN